MFPFVSTITELAAECSFPVGEAMSVGCMVAGGEFFGFIMGMSFETLLDGYKKEWSRIVILVCILLTAVSSCILFRVKESLNKQKFEQKSTRDLAALKMEDGI